MTTAIIKSEQSLAAQDAAQLRRQIELELSGAVGKEEELSRSYVRIGILLYKFRQKEYWRELDYSGFDHFISEIGARFDRGRTQLYEYVSVVEKLLPQVDARLLEEMGTSKARILRQAQKAAGGRAIPENVLNAACQSRVTANQLRTIAHEAYHVTQPDAEKGTWIDLGFYATLDEREILKRAFRTAERTDPVIPKDIPDHLRRRESVLRWAMEYLASFEAAANRGEA